MSPNSPENDHDDSNGSAPTKNTPELACNGCRKSKLRCSRERPTCSHCRKTSLDCVYETKRTKPGLKAGAVENLHRRLDALENLVHERERNPPAAPTTAVCHDVNHNGASTDAAAYNVLALLAKELPKLIKSGASPPSVIDNNIDHRAKRRRPNGDEPLNTPRHGDIRLPHLAALEKIIAAYFTHIHPWIPMIHQARFRQRMSVAMEYPKLEVILHAMVYATSKYLPEQEVPESALLDSRKWVVWRAMDSVSPESLQALTILAFTDIGNGHCAKAWSIVGSLTRTVEYSQLTQERELGSHQPFCRPYSFIQDVEDWTEVEERRRIFWNIFNLDRFCSITMGWNTSLTSDDVHRRLPCDGPLWRKQTPVVTPYFGIWDKSAGRIGNPVAFLPQYQSPSEPVNDVEIRSRPDAASAASPNQNLLVDTTIGAFAYCIEATESMSRITSYFLQQKIDIRDEREINSWLTRFKELDLRLVHWKMLLPQKWKTNMERQSTLMDPNLTTAHVTHNASMILLHQLIAYPPLNWGFRHKLPSHLSAEACQSAGIEIARITQNYLSNSNNASPIGSQYAFCLYIAARMLLIHWKYSAENSLDEQFWSLIQSLEELSKRWQALSRDRNARSLAERYADRLKELYTSCMEVPGYSIDVMDYTNEIRHCAMTPYGDDSRSITTPTWSSQHRLRTDIRNGVDTMIPSIPQHENPRGDSIDSQHMAHVEEGANPLNMGDFNTIPQMMLDQQFMNMDRVIAFDDGSMFTASLDHGNW